MNNPITLIAAAASVASILIALFVAPPGSGYRVAPAFLVPMLWIVYALRRWLHLRPVHYALFATAVLFHNYGGARGYYQQRFFGINFDVYVHGYFGFVGGVLFHQFLRHHVPSLTPWFLLHGRAVRDGVGRHPRTGGVRLDAGAGTGEGDAEVGERRAVRHAARPAEQPDWRDRRPARRRPLRRPPRPRWTGPSKLGRGRHERHTPTTTRGPRLDEGTN